MSLYTDTYDKIVADTITITNRPDLSAETEIAVRTATLSCHAFGAYPRDLSTQLIKVTEPSFVTAIDITKSLPRFRGLHNIIATDVDGNPMDNPVIDIIDISEVRDPEYGNLRTNVAYVAGTALNIRASQALNGYILSWYQYPDTRRENYNSWIAQLAQDIIVMYAASIVLRTNGNNEKAESLWKQVNNVLLPQLNSNFLTTQMR